MNDFYMKKLINGLKEENFDAMLICPSQELRLLTGYTPGMCERFQGLFVKSSGEMFYFCNIIYQGEAEKNYRDEIPVYGWFDGDVMTEEIYKVLQKYDLCKKKIAVNSSAPAFSVLDIAEKCDIEFVNGKYLLENIRACKTHEELEDMRKAASIADSAFCDVLDFIKAGMTEGEISEFLHRHMEKDGGYGCWSIVASGPNSSYPHYAGNDRVIQKGDAIVIDFGCVYNGLCSDTSRTVFVGSVSDRFKELYSYVDESNRAGEQKAAEGVLCCDVDKAARDVLKKYGYDKTLINRVGHGIGRMIHEAPDIKGSNTTVLQKGMCFSIEPGIYLSGDVGMRIEDIVCINEKGETEVLNKSPRDLFVVDKD